MKQSSLIFLVLLFFAGCGMSGSSSDSSSSTSVNTAGASADSSTRSGQGGSLARFAISGDYLYTLNDREMNIFDIQDASEPRKASKIHVPWDVETIFSYKDYLYIGSSSGMYIYDNSIAVQPTHLTDFTHAQSCDPIVVSDDIAFVTLNTRNCWSADNSINRLEIVDVQDPKSPRLIQTVDMWAPTGLGVDGSNLFICDGDSGLKIFDINKSDNNGTVDVLVELKDSYGEIDCYDVIAYDENLIVSNRDEIRQFDYSSFPMEELGRIK
ncbi:hypothetical protein GSY74_06295 [Sulfurovum sp. bin170]|uniref:LVIVD repeat-containing protein n=1 Tax=Sulfurovum sp. bin170 TaxID=2695268 RepID=UPI0013DFB176|nr:hypothetical protein [Sulfurovum sp. bin170]NEW60889.1 hypothetical protein [Sulfurovum sp. bin170]